MADPQRALRKATAIGPDPNVPSREGLTGLFNWLVSLGIPIYPEQEVSLLDLVAAVPPLKGAKSLAALAKTEKAADTALDLSRAAREARAADMGFNVDVYHGSPRGDITEFRIGDVPQTTAGGAAGRAVFTSPDPRTASKYAEIFSEGGQGGTVYPLKARVKDPLKLSASDWYRLQEKIRDNPKILDDLRAKGYDAIISDTGRYGMAEPEVVILDARNLRSRFAKFDPRKALSADLLASLAPLGLIPLSQLGQSRETR